MSRVRLQTVIASLFAACTWIIAVGAPALAQSVQKAAVYTASELPRFAERGIDGFEGRYTMKVWSPARQVWSLQREGAAYTLRPSTQGDDNAPRWRTVGEVDVEKGARLKIKVVGEETKKSEKEKDKGKGQKSTSEVVAVPTVVALSSDPKFDPAAALDLIRARLDTVEPTADPRREHVRTNQEGANFEPPTSAEAWRDRAAHVRAQLLVAMGLWPMFPKTPLNPAVHGAPLRRDGYTIERFTLETFPRFICAGNLYRPDGPAAGKRPVVLCPHGHWADGRVNPEVQQRCIRLAKLGCVVVMYDMVGYNDSKPFGHAFLNDRLRRWGLSLVTLQTWNSIRVLDWVATLPDVDPERIGCTGESGGGTQTFLLTAIDPRVKVAAPVVMVSEGFQGGCVCENCAGLRIGTDNVEFAALTAPRPLKLVGATGDWTKHTLTTSYPAIEKVYRLLGTPDRVSAEVFDFPHNYNQTSRNAVYPFLARWLLGVNDAARTKEGEQTPEKPEDLWAFTEKHPAPRHAQTPETLERDLIERLTHELAALAPGGSAPRWEASKALLQTSHAVRVDVVNPPPAALIAAEVRCVKRDGFRADHWVVGRKSVGELIPVLRLRPAQPSGKLTVVVSPHGKAVLVEADGTESPLAKALLARGQNVVGFDSLFVGESVDPATGRLGRPDTVHYATYNPALVADQMQDLATVLAWARSLPDVRAVNLIGHGRAGVQVLLARPLLEGVSRTAVDLHSVPEGEGAEPFPAALDLPGLHQFGGLKAAAALAAPAALWLYRPAATFDRAWPEDAYALAGTPHALSVTAAKPADDALARWIDTGERD